MNSRNKMRENSEIKGMRSDLRKRELTSLIYLILRLLNSNSLRERESENEIEWEIFVSRGIIGD